ncbi:MAG: ribonuclease III [bacterium P3]|nr:MAG: ribonuclease III [bacterium P3]KWW41008.1 MAG: ribonuclease III [bacterium F083]
MIARLLSIAALRREDKDLYFFFKNVLGFKPHHIELYHIALTHRSKSQDLGHGHRINNERLEYLGDAVLSSVVADYLYHKYPHKEEGFLTELRSIIVSRNNLNRLGNKIGLSKLIRFDSRSNGAFKSKEGDGVEALVGAIYLDRGYVFAKKVIIERFLRFYMDVDQLAHLDWNYKSKLLDWGQHNKHKIKFVVQKTTYQGSRSRTQYDVVATIDGKAYRNARADSIKAAEQLAAEKTYLYLQKKGESNVSTDDVGTTLNQQLTVKDGMEQPLQVGTQL